MAAAAVAAGGATVETGLGAPEEMDVEVQAGADVFFAAPPASVPAAAAFAPAAGVAAADAAWEVAAATLFSGSFEA